MNNATTTKILYTNYCNLARDYAADYRLKIEFENMPYPHEVGLTDADRLRLIARLEAGMRFTDQRMQNIRQYLLKSISVDIEAHYNNAGNVDQLPHQFGAIRYLKLCKQGFGGGEKITYSQYIFWRWLFQEIPF